ncbi:hypothetical protein KIN20_003798 [Parelaphostrongylus tenuis]|uniref:Uncharacterized protein n=1 Tax=Parelaphostrongylus tenuis TaxID=148309 RepID=A0AAD5M0S8_PARTN|nr:hypothetical protein KIN20_003798 [Parelaphostrongylus tenuis]
MEDFFNDFECNIIVTPLLSKFSQRNESCCEFVCGENRCLSCQCLLENLLAVVCFNFSVPFHSSSLLANFEHLGQAAGSATE